MLFLQSVVTGFRALERRTPHEVEGFEAEGPKAAPGLCV
jgi:hypothetical protein